MNPTQAVLRPAVTALRVVRDQPAIDLEAAEAAAGGLLSALGLSLDDPDLAATHVGSRTLWPSC